MHKILDWVVPLLPENKPRHLLGIGAVEDLFNSVERGIDMFDCVGPTRWARNGHFGLWRDLWYVMESAIMTQLLWWKRNVTIR